MYKRQLVGVDGETYGRLRVVLCVWWCCGGVVVFRGVLRFKKGVCSKRVSGCVVLEAFSSRARFICTTVVQIGVAMDLLSPPKVGVPTRHEQTMPEDGWDYLQSIGIGDNFFACKR